MTSIQSSWPCLAAALLLASAAAASDARRSPTVSVVEKTRNCVVNISTERVVLQRSFDSSPSRGDPFDRLFDEFFRPQRYERARVMQPLGSGVILDERGVVATNAHVIRRASNLVLLLGDGNQHKADLLAADFDVDLALLRIQGGSAPFQAVRMCRTPLLLGETVVALGNPFGLSNSVTSGIISSLDRELTVGEGEEERKFTGLIQTSALINPGNSGGPLINMDAELVGLNTAIVDQAQGIGFAIPVEQMRKALAHLLAAPEVRQVQLGLAFHAEPPLRVARTPEKGPAAGVGLREGDLVESLDGRAIGDAFDLGMALLFHKPADRVEVRYRRNGQSARAAIVLAEAERTSDENVLQRALGLIGQDVDEAVARRIGLSVPWGVLLSRVEARGPADRAGIQAGDLLVQIGRYRVQNLHQAARILRDVRSGDAVLLGIVREGYLARVRIRAR
jgi:serine protease Do